MNNKKTILIADRKPSIRKFLKREIDNVNFNVVLAKNGQEVIDMVFKDELLDFLIIDPELPFNLNINIWEKLNMRIPPLPILIHGFRKDYESQTNLLKNTVFIQKSGHSSIEIKKYILDFFKYDTISGE